MKIISKQVQVKKTLENNKIEQELSQYGEPLRWAIVKTDNNYFIIDAVFIEN